MITYQDRKKGAGMLNGSVTYVIVIIWGVWILRGDRIERESPTKILLSLVFTFYISRVIAATFFPFPIDGAIIDQQRAMSNAGFGVQRNLTPFATVLDAADSGPQFIQQIVGNFLLLFPLGFLAPLVVRRVGSATRAIVLVVATTMGIEFSQLAISAALGFSYRSFDVDDLWLNATGGALGVLVSMLVIRKATWLAPNAEPREATNERREEPELPSGITSSRETALYRSEL